ncbi:nitrate reductase associated protein [Spirulina major]|uniref:nitrate reductase associated protein n=1 Tax=Spirulina major TaxID=270636 RepID=UPI0009322409|nr:nitrate reductase associated protein [Spirulina major]
MTFFQFEQDFVESLRCIPMRVRMKLDTCGVKLKLDHWNRFSLDERQTLVDQPCTTDSEATLYRDQLQAMVIAHMGKPASELEIPAAPPWLDVGKIPAAVTEQAAKVGLTITLEQWQSLQPDQRFALIKLSRPSHENRNFKPAMMEFGLA